MRAIEFNQPLAAYTAFDVGGQAAQLLKVQNSAELVAALECANSEVNLLGYGANVIISDKGLQGLTIICNGGQIERSATTLIADAGVWWDDLVSMSVNEGLWGIELMTAIPGSVGAAAKININAYGQAFGDHCSWVEAWNPATRELVTISKSELKWGYKQSIFLAPEYQNHIITRICLELSNSPTTSLTYESALRVARSEQLDSDNLEHRRQIIMGARREAGSLWEPHKDFPKTVGSFFRNPIVNQAQVEAVIKYDETGKTAQQLLNMNAVHGGSTNRASAAHILLAAGFERGQVFRDFGGHVGIHKDHVLKLENLGDASAQEIYNVAKFIKATVKEKLNIDLESEAVFMGEFDETA